MNDNEPLQLDEDLWPAPTPPSDFAAQVMEAYAPEAQPAPRPRWVWVVAVAAALLATLALGRVLLRGGPSQDSLDADHRQTIALGDRATAVAEAGASLAWTVESSGATRIDQGAGRVFYRVDHGETFDVSTPLGTVSVTGTCFTVDLQPKDSPMNKTNVRAGALGAALASALVVTVYEGSVVMANDEGSVELSAGQAARATDARAPVRFDPDGDDGVADSADDDAKEAKPKASKPGSIAGDPIAQIRRQERDIARIREEKDAQAVRIAELEAQVTALGGSIEPNSPEAKKARAKLCATQSRGGGCPFLEPDQETLLEMAKCASVKIDSPGFLDDREPPDVGQIAGNLGIDDPGEIEKLEVAANAAYEAYNSQLRAMYLELGGDEAIAEDASADTLMSAIGDQLDPQMMETIQRRIAQERAGLHEVPETLEGAPMEERLFRLIAEKGNDFETHMADALGVDRARELRRRADGWPGSTSVHSGRCVE
ncbi:MAG: hypothetical protein AAGA54_20900 [Myxococcota bacterium]